jgi:hypothetical protein
MEMIAAGPKPLATLCSMAVVELVLNKPRALLLNPCDRQLSTAPIDRIVDTLTPACGSNDGEGER